MLLMVTPPSPGPLTAVHCSLFTLLPAHPVGYEPAAETFECKFKVNFNATWKGSLITAFNI